MDLQENEVTNENVLERCSRVGKKSFTIDLDDDNVVFNVAALNALGVYADTIAGDYPIMSDALMNFWKEAYEVVLEKLPKKEAVTTIAAPEE